MKLQPGNFAAVCVGVCVFAALAVRAIIDDRAAFARRQLYDSSKSDGKS